MSAVTRPVACALAATLIAALLPLSECQSGPVPDGAFIQGLAPNDTKIEALASGEALNGTLPHLYYEALGFSVPNRSDEGLGFPDVLLSLDVTSPGGDVDVFCSPYVEVDGKFWVPGPFDGRHTWASNHSQGTDYVFISHRHPSYEHGARPEGNKTMADFVCTLWGMARSVSEYRLEVELDYSPRSLDGRERQAVRSLYSKCCGGEGGCEQWRRMERLMTGADESDLAPPLDLCHVVGNACDGEGRLIRLSMVGFGLECEFPAKEVAAFSRVEKVDLSHNELWGDIGVIAGELQKLEHLVILSAVQNNINGSLNDTRVCSLVSSGLETIDMDVNVLTGPLPSCLFDTDSTLKEIDLDSNDIGSTLPQSFAQDSKLEVLSLADTNLTGSLPASMENLKSLRTLSLGYNDLTGALPADIGASQFLTTVSLLNNRLEGPVPASLATNPALRILVLSNNSFSELADAWHQPGAIGPNLDEFSCKENEVEGALPAALFTSNVTLLDLSFNKFDGPLPTLDNMLPKAWYLGLANNSVSGPIPDEWSNLGIFSGSALEDFFGVPLLDFRNNRLSGSIPRFLLNSTGLSSTVLAITGIFLNGNDFDCLELGPLETSHHLIGVSECEDEEEPGSDAGPSLQASGAESSDADVRLVANDDRSRGSETGSANGEERTATAAVAAVAVGAFGAVVVVVVVAAVVFSVVKKRRQASSGVEAVDIEGARGVTVRFSKYTDEVTEADESVL